MMDLINRIRFRVGNEKALASEFLQKAQETGFSYKIKKEELADNIHNLDVERILAVHYACGGAQGEGGAVEILYFAENGIKAFHGNYCYGKLDVDAVYRKLPMLQCLDDRNTLEPTYPFGGRLSVPPEWGYLYMGCMNHLYARIELCDKITPITERICAAGQSWALFDAIAWFCGCDYC